MTQLEKDQKLADLKTRLEMLENERRALEAAPVTTHKVWEPDTREKYWISTAVDEYRNFNNTWDKERIESGCTHPTKEAAERHHSFLVTLHDLHKFAVEHNEGWKPDWSSCENGKWVLSMMAGDLDSCTSYSRRNVSPLPAFKSKELAQKAIDTFGDRLKILFEYYNS